MLIDLLTSRSRIPTCRSTQVKIVSTNLWPQEMFTFSEMLLRWSKSSFGAYVCHRRPGGFTATSDLVFLSCLHCTMWLRTYYPGQKNWDNRAHMAQARDLSSMHAPMFGLRACLIFFGQGSSREQYNKGHHVFLYHFFSVLFNWFSAFPSRPFATLQWSCCLFSPVLLFDGFSVYHSRPFTTLQRVATSHLSMAVVMVTMAVQWWTIDTMEPGDSTTPSTTTPHWMGRRHNHRRRQALRLACVRITWPMWCNISLMWTVAVLGPL